MDKRKDPVTISPPANPLANEQTDQPESDWKKTEPDFTPDKLIGDDLDIDQAAHGELHGEETVDPETPY